jgi:hypothetical protein
MLPYRSVRRASGFLLGIVTIFDLTGVAVFRLARNSLPDIARPSAGPQRPVQQRAQPRRQRWQDSPQHLDATEFALAAAEIQSAYREVMMHAGDGRGGVTLTAWPTTTTSAA